MFEIFEKDDANHDPLLDFDFEAGVLRRQVPNNKAAEAIGPDAKAGDLMGEEPLGESRYADVTPQLIGSLRSLTSRRSRSSRRRGTGRAASTSTSRSSAASIARPATYW